jgi:hypothetical protein
MSRKKLFLFLFLVGVSLTVSAQVMWGIKGDICFSEKRSPGFCSGVVNNILLSNRLSIQSEMLLVKEGARSTKHITTVSPFAFELPMMLKYQFVGELNLLAGTYFSYRMRQRWDYGVTLGTEYSLSRQWAIELCYNVSLLNRMKDSSRLDSHFIQTGIIYRFK